MSAFERVEIDYAGVAEMLCSPELHAVVQAAAEQIADHARRTSARTAIPHDLRISTTVALCGGRSALVPPRSSATRPE